ncbi:MAG: DivIVA domain-containing protein [Actinomycetes bacterium]
MLVLVLEVLAAVGVLFVVAVAASGRAGSMSPARPDRSPVRLPTDRPLTGEDVSRVRFGVALRGYRMDAVDDVLDRLTAELDARDAKLASFGVAPVPAPPSPTTRSDPTPTAYDEREVADMRSVPPGFPPEPTTDPTGRHDYAAPHYQPGPTFEPGPPRPPPDAPSTPPQTSSAPPVPPTTPPAPSSTPPPAGPLPGGGYEHDEGVYDADEAAYAPADPDDEPEGPYLADSAGPDPPRDRPTDEWRAVYDELRPPDVVAAAGAGPRRIVGEEEPSEDSGDPDAQEPGDPYAEDTNPRWRRGRGEEGSWPSSW